MNLTWAQVEGPALAELDREVVAINASADPDGYVTEAQDQRLGDIRAEKTRILDGGLREPEGCEVEDADSAETPSKGTAALWAELDASEGLSPTRRAATLKNQLDADSETFHPRNAATLRAKLYADLTPPSASAVRAALHRRAVGRTAYLTRYAWRVCYHEGGHIVAALKRKKRALEAHFLYGSEGQLVGAETVFAEPAIDPVVAAAGFAAAVVGGYAANRADCLSPGDKKLLADQGFSSPEQQALAVAAATRLVRENWEAITRVADELFAAGTVSADRVLEILKEEGPRT